MAENWRDRNRRDDRFDQDWHSDRDWRSREYGTRNTGDRGYDTLQYTNADYVARDYGRDDRYTPEQNVRGQPDKERRWHNVHTGGLSGYAGRGPKNWKRSDERILEDVNESLTRSPYVDASEIEVTTSGGEVTLSGTVNDRWEKREAEDAAWAIPGVRDVHNHIRVGQVAQER